MASWNACSYRSACDVKNKKASPEAVDMTCRVVVGCGVTQLSVLGADRSQNTNTKKKYETEKWTRDGELWRMFPHRS